MKGRKCKSDVKRASMEYIDECLRENKRFREIYKNLEERLKLESVAKKTIQSWISALKSSNRMIARKKLGVTWMPYWYALHPDTLGDDESEQGVDESSGGLAATGSEAGSTMVVDEAHDELPDIIDIINRDGLLRMQIIPNPVSLLETETSIQIPRREPQSIIGKATLNGQTCFMVKWKGPFEDELGKKNIILLVFSCFIIILFI